MKDESIRDGIKDIIRTFLTDEKIDYANPLHINKALQIIMGHSIQALNFVSIIEEEFHIELDDHDVNLSTFSELENLVSLISKYSGELS